MRIVTFASGSTGNCSLISDGGVNILIDAGMGVSLIPNIKGLDDYKVKRLKVDPPCYRSVGVSWAKNRYLPPAASEFKQYLVDYFNERKE